MWTVSEGLVAPGAEAAGDLTSLCPVERGAQPNPPSPKMATNETVRKSDFIPKAPIPEPSGCIRQAGAGDRELELYPPVVESRVSMSSTTDQGIIID